MNMAEELTKKNSIVEQPKQTGMNDYPAKSQDLQIQALVHHAAKCIAPVWPLETFIACNPLQGFEAQTFEEALAQGGFRRKRSERNLPLEDVNLKRLNGVVVSLMRDKAILKCHIAKKDFILDS